MMIYFLFLNIFFQFKILEFFKKQKSIFFVSFFFRFAKITDYYINSIAFLEQLLKKNNRVIDLYRSKIINRTKLSFLRFFYLCKLFFLLIKIRDVTLFVCFLRKINFNSVYIKKPYFFNFLMLKDFKWGIQQNFLFICATVSSIFFFKTVWNARDFIFDFLRRNLFETEYNQEQKRYVRSSLIFNNKFGSSSLNIYKLENLKSKSLFDYFYFYFQFFFCFFFNLITIVLCFFYVLLPFFFVFFLFFFCVFFLTCFFFRNVRFFFSLLVCLIFYFYLKILRFFENLDALNLSVYKMQIRGITSRICIKNFFLFFLSIVILIFF